MKFRQRITCMFLVLFIVLAAGAVHASLTIERDDKGVWFITGDEDETIYNVFEAMGYAVSTDRLWQAETYRRMARGTTAELFGPDFFRQDMLARITGYSDAELTAGYQNLDQEVRDMVDGYVAGFNRRIGEVAQDPSQLPFEFYALRQRLQRPDLLPNPWTPEDVLAWQAAMLRQFDPEANRRGQLDNGFLLQFLMSQFGQEQGMMMFNDLRWRNDPDATTYIPGSPQQSHDAVTQGLRGAGSSRINHDAAMPGVVDISGIGNVHIAAENLNRLWADRDAQLKKIGAFPKMGSYAWVLSGDKTESGLPVIYAGPQMGFHAPAIVTEGSIEAGGLRISGMSVPGLPGIIIGRTPRHAWSMQVGHARTVDYYFEPAPGEVENYYTSRIETINVAGQGPVTIAVFSTPNGPVINPAPFNPATYDLETDGPIVSWKYAHRGKEFNNLRAFLNLPRAGDMDEFGEALLDVAVSQHFCYADTDGNIAYWMTGFDPVRPDVNANGIPVDWRVPQGMLTGPAQWDADNRKPLSTDRNTAQGFYAGWNNKSSPDYPNAYNNTSYYFGPFHRTHVIDAYLRANDNLTFEEIRDIALHIATTDSFGGGGNPWAFVETHFTAAVQANPTDARLAALDILEAFDGHFVAGGRENRVDGEDRSDGWILADAWIKEVLELTFADELEGSNQYHEEHGLQNPIILFNVLVRGLAGEDAALTNNYDWFQNESDQNAPQTAETIIVAALDNVLAEQLDLDDRPWGVGERESITFKHPMFDEPLHEIPFASRSTYAHVVEMDTNGPSRIESMLPLGQSGSIRITDTGEPAFDPHFFSMTSVFDDFSHRDFPVFETDPDDGSGSSSSSTCFIESLRSRE